MSPITQPNLSPTIGAWLIGTTASSGLLGITTMQCWMYYSRFIKDPPFLKVLVFCIWCLEVARTMICLRGGYFYAIEHWGDIPAILSPVWSLEAMVLLTAPIELLAHIFFAHQVRKVTREKYRILFYIIIVFSLGDFAFSISSYVAAVSDGTFAGIVFGKPSHIATAALGCSMIADWTITISLVSFLRKNKIHKTRALIQILMLYAVNFGLLISLTDLVVLIMANVKWPMVNLYQVSLFEVVGNFYANTMLASLNSRMLVAEHLYRPDNLHFTSINAPSAHPSDASLSLAETHCQVTSEGENGGNSRGGNDV